MGNTILGPKIEKTNRYVNGIFQFDAGAGNTFQYQFCKDVEVSLDDSAVDRDRIDDGTPAFTRVGDILGRFRFHLKNTADIYDTTDVPTLQQTISYWMYKIANLDFASLAFIETQYAPNSAGSKFARLKFTGRITKVTHTRTDNVGVEDDEIEGEITAWGSADRAAS